MSRIEEELNAQPKKPSVFEELKARVIGGEKVTAKQLTDARAQDELADLQVLADERAAKAAEAAALKAAQDKFIAEDYEDFMTTDIEPLRQAYADLVVAVADVHTLLEEHKKKQSEILVEASKLGLRNLPRQRSASAWHKLSDVPVQEDRERWSAQYVRGDFIAYAMEEGQRGFTSRNARVVAHALHTPERQEELRSLDQSVDNRQRGVEMRDRMLAEALAE